MGRCIIFVSRLIRLADKLGHKAKLSQWTEPKCGRADEEKKE